MKNKILRVLVIAGALIGTISLGGCFYGGGYAGYPVHPAYSYVAPYPVYPAHPIAPWHYGRVGGLRWNGHHYRG